MQGLHDAAQIILQILRDTAWSGVGGICALIGIPLAFMLARRSKPHLPQNPNTAKINRARRSIPSNGTRLFITNGYHRATLAKELVKDVDILVVVDPKKLTL